MSTFEAVVKDYGNFIHQTLSRSGLAPHELADVAQAVLLGVRERLWAFTQQPGKTIKESLIAWLRGICQRQAASFRRERWHCAERSTETDELDEEPSAGATPEEDAERSRAREMLMELLFEIDPRFRCVVVAHYLEDEPMEEIAKRLSIPLNTAWNRRRLGLSQLRAAWCRRLASLKPGREDENG